MILLIHAHPHPDRSIGGRALLEAVRDIPGISVRSLYDLYPDFSIDVAAERAALIAARLVIWQHPLYWYGTPALLKLWFESVLTEGWAFGSQRALAGKDCLWVTTTGGGADAFTPEGRHGNFFDAFVPPVAQAARFCGMNFLPPLVVYGPRRMEPQALRQQASEYRALLAGFGARHG
ncbi:MAG TPA: NAD(P)H-dependent oxidoreductase [Burkholderiaceae bacterium]|nr:NAD(P)H-dependent oxidoreductase [Burkholderiaceae bacterium]